MSYAFRGYYYSYHFGFVFGKPVQNSRIHIQPSRVVVFTCVWILFHLEKLFEVSRWSDIDFFSNVIPMERFFENVMGEARAFNPNNNSIMQNTATLVKITLRHPFITGFKDNVLLCPLLESGGFNYGFNIHGFFPFNNTIPWEN